MWISMWIDVDLYEIIWIHVDLCGLMWKYMELYIPDAPWCWNIYLHRTPTNHLVMQVNIPYMEHLGMDLYVDFYVDLCDMDVMNGFVDGFLMLSMDM